MRIKRRYGRSGLRLPLYLIAGDGFLKTPARMRVIRFLMRETMFDESYNIREVLDDVIERVTLREKLIQTAKGFAEKKKEERYTLAIRQFENLMTDFLRLYHTQLSRSPPERTLHLEVISRNRQRNAGSLERNRGIGRKTAAIGK